MAPALTTSEHRAPEHSEHTEHQARVLRSETAWRCGASMKNAPSAPDAPARPGRRRHRGGGIRTWRADRSRTGWGPKRAFLQIDVLTRPIRTGHRIARGRGAVASRQAVFRGPAPKVGCAKPVEKRFSAADFGTAAQPDWRSQNFNMALCVFSDGAGARARWGRTVDVPPPVRFLGTRKNLRVNTPPVRSRSPSSSQTRPPSLWCCG